MADSLSYDQRVERLRSFMQAAQDGNISELRRHLDAGMHINTQYPEGETAVLQAAFYNQPEAVRFLARAGADLDIPQDQGGTPLIWAIHRGHKDCVAALVENFADLKKPNFGGQLPLDIAQFEQKTDIAAMIRDGIATEPARRAEAAVKLQRPLTVKRPLQLKGLP